MLNLENIFHGVLFSFAKVIGTAVFASEQLFCSENIAVKQHRKVLLLLRSRIIEKIYRISGHDKFLWLKFSFLFLFFCCPACSKQNNPAAHVSVQLIDAFPRLSFIQPVDLQSPADQSNRIFVVEQQGVISVFENNPLVEQKKEFLDIRDQVRTGHMEEGLLGLVFHPDYKKNGYFYVDYIADNPRRTIIARFTRSADNPDQADKSSKLVILEVEQPFGNHNGGQLAFGPDGYLYIAFGDGGGAGDPFDNGQNRRSLLGKLLRIDVDHPDPGKNYGIPLDNPFKDSKEGFKGEIYAYGLRNPWRFSFDPVSKWLWAGDVGQDKPIEEVDIVRKGENYGWNIMEGSQCFKPTIGCQSRGIKLPIWEYSLDQGRCVTGGYVYRGKRMLQLEGYFIYGDFVSGRIWGLFYDGTQKPVNIELAHNPNLYPSSFGRDPDQELLVCSFDGHIYRLENPMMP